MQKSRGKIYDGVFNKYITFFFKRERSPPYCCVEPLVVDRPLMRFVSFLTVLYHIIEAIKITRIN